jgi:hypothetical protein
MIMWASKACYRDSFISPHPSPPKKTVCTLQVLMAYKQKKNKKRESGRIFK